MYIGYSVGFMKKTRWCCFPFTAASSLFSLHETVSLFPSLCSEPSFHSKPHSHSSSFTLLLGAISDLFGAELCECLSKRKGICQLPLNCARIKSILTHYPCVLLSPKCSSQFLQTHIHFLFSPPSSKRKGKKSQNKLGKRGRSA